MFDADALNHADYAYAKKKEGKIRLLAVLLVLLYITFTVGFFLLCYLSRLIPFFAVAPLFLWILVYFTWRYVSYDIYYTFESGTLTFYRRTGKKTKRGDKILLTLRVQETEGAYDGGDPREERAATDGKFYDFSSSRHAEATVLLRFAEDGRGAAVLFDVTPRVRELIRSFAPHVYFTK
ncbi:MAG TPA: hypothetical protein DDY70_05580 [Clostridiales bacterium]|nr:hypothetical protein [Clostridiales bacterium]